MGKFLCKALNTTFLLIRCSQKSSAKPTRASCGKRIEIFMQCCFLTVFSTITLSSLLALHPLQVRLSLRTSTTQCIGEGKARAYQEMVVLAYQVCLGMKFCNTMTSCCQLCRKHMFCLPYRADSSI